MRKTILGIYDAPPLHWVGDSFPVRSLFSYRNHGKLLSPFLLLDYAGPIDFASTARHEPGYDRKKPLAKTSNLHRCSMACCINPLVEREFISTYSAGSWGLAEANRLFDSDDQIWRNAL